MSLVEMQGNRLRQFGLVERRNSVHVGKTMLRLESSYLPLVLYCFLFTHLELRGVGVNKEDAENRIRWRWLIHYGDPCGADERQGRRPWLSHWQAEATLLCEGQSDLETDFCDQHVSGEKSQCNCLLECLLTSGLDCLTWSEGKGRVLKHNMILRKKSVIKQHWREQYTFSLQRLLL